MHLRLLQLKQLALWHADMRAKIADAYADRVDKYDKYVKEFEVRSHYKLYITFSRLPLICAHASATELSCCCAEGKHLMQLRANKPACSSLYAAQLHINTLLHCIFPCCSPSLPTRGYLVPMTSTASSSLVRNALKCSRRCGCLQGCA